MTETIISLLKAHCPDGWTVTEERTEGHEFYFIGHKLDQNRLRRTKHITVKVFVKSEDGEILGEASQEIPPTATEDEALSIIERLKAHAVYVKNPFYELQQPMKDVSEDASNEMAANAEDAADPEDIARDFLTTLTSIAETETEDINSYEIFVNRVTKRFVSATGIDRTETYPYAMAEVVVNARRDGHEIELYRMYESGTCDKEYLKREIEKTLLTGRDRLIATPLPALQKIDVVFSGTDAKAIFRWYIDRLSAGMVYQKYSDFEIGKAVSGDVTGDTVTVEAKKSLPNSSKNRAFDPDGATVRDLLLMKENVPEAYFGSRQFSYYLGMKDGFLAENFKVTGGTADEAELRTGDYLEAVEFSDFQVDPISGDVAGELRFGYLHRNGEVIPVSGGSLSGSMNDFVRTIRFTKETTQYDELLIPSLTRLFAVNVTGAV